MKLPESLTARNFNTMKKISSMLVGYCPVRLGTGGIRRGIHQGILMAGKTNGYKCHHLLFERMLSVVGKDVISGSQH